MSYNTAKSRPKAVLVAVPLPDVSDEESLASLAELRRLVTTLGFDVVGQLSQRRPSLSGATVLGEGKLRELAHLTGGTGVVEKKAPIRKSKAAKKLEEAEENADEDIEEEALEEDDHPSDGTLEEPKELATVVVFDCELSPSQLANLQSATGVEVLDRTGVIVEIFSRHARTREARLQVEIARLNYLAPRIRETGDAGGDRMGGMAGETSLELDRRKIRDRIAELRRELEAIQRDQSANRAGRAKQNTVALVGYTNAGKSSLMRALTGSEVLVEDKLFATLDTTVRTLQPVTVPKILVSDTVGFIKKLPHDLVASFRSTLDEAKNASLLLYVVDCSDAGFRSQLEVTREVLSSIGVSEIPSWLVLNKIDKVTEDELKALEREFPEAFAMSTKRSEDVARLRETLLAFFEQDMVEEELFVPYVAKGVVGKLRASARVLKERYEDDGVFYLIRATSDSIAKLKKDIEKG